MFTNSRFWIFWIFIAVVLGFSAFKIKGKNRVPQQVYKVIFADSDFEIRHYPSAHLVKVRKEGEFESTRYSGFRALAGYIFGGNSAEQKIAMTAPVIYTHNESERVSEMSFVLPQEVPPGAQPSPQSNEIYFETTPPAYYAVISRGGWPSQKTLKKMEATLLSAISKKGLSAEGAFEYRYYNPPFELFNRNTEVSIRIKDYQ